MIKKVSNVVITIRKRRALIMKESVMRLAIDAKLVSNRRFCQWLSAVSEKHCDKMSIETILFSSSSMKLMPLVASFQEFGVIFNQVFHTNKKMKTALLAEIQPDILFADNKNSILLEAAFKSSVAACTIENDDLKPKFNRMHLVFDADAVLFSDEAEQVNLKYGFEKFDEHEWDKREQLLPSGPLFSFIKKINIMQKHNIDVQWSLLTARSGRALFRAIKTIEHWQLEPAHMFFMSGGDKSTVLKSLDAHIFFDDKHEHCQAAKPYAIAVHVPMGLNINVSK
ncbi:5'-nucleotidase [Shewanella sp. 6_MG-2023]|uniref:5'-nucleotidase n=1 Tax=Shewanella sp. 6_MG-2023 TaxID=3062660 RepID=UPI0026E1D5BC|nr:5'-nucleotidase [Shewanella sp. 6_MG-2023]MDO6621084.1 5'-nucleotidase [Shewanella sp. 6_MG-2023]